jgi:hypothetical protein
MATRQTQCSSKKRHHGHGAAELAAEEYLLKFGEKMSVYKCEYCHGYHIGHPKRKLNKRMDDDAVARHLANGEEVPDLDDASMPLLTLLRSKFR